MSGTRRSGTPYDRSEARAWAREHMRGVCDVIIPSFTADLSGLNERGIRHDVRRNIELGFWGALLVSEAGTTLDEMRQFMEIAVDEAQGRHYLVLHGTFDTLDQQVAMAAAAKQAGVDAVLFGYPNSFYPVSSSDLYEYTRKFCERVDLGVILFAAHHWNFERIDVSGFPLEVLVRAAAELPNVVAVKYEVGRPGAVGTYECFKALAGSGVLVSDPFEPNAPIWTENFEMPWMGTSNYEYFGDMVPRTLEALHQGRREDAMKLYWQMQPARTARLAEQATFGGANFIHRYLWKYQAWLNGFNGGPLRQPAMKLSDAQMRRMADALRRAGIADPKDELSSYFVGRNPA
jgi:dihydrodipicolinate synthase/N-acetylneuraminate lyase